MHGYFICIEVVYKEKTPRKMADHAFYTADRSFEISIRLDSDVSFNFWKRQNTIDFSFIHIRTFATSLIERPLKVMKQHYYDFRISHA